MTDFFTTAEAADISGCSRRQLQYWRDKEIVVPEVNASGRGRSVYYSAKQLLQLLIMSRLLEIGLSFEIAAETLMHWQDCDPGFFEEPLSAVPQSYMVFSNGNKLQFNDYSDTAAISCVIQGDACIPLWGSLIQKSLKSRLESQSMPTSS